MRKRAIEVYVVGGNLRRVARHLKVALQTVAYWVTDVAEALPSASLPNEVKEAEMDECSLSLAIKKGNLCCQSGRSQNSMHFGLDSGLGAHAGSYSTQYELGSQS